MSNCAPFGLNEYRADPTGYESFLGEVRYDAKTGTHYRVVKAAAAITAAAKKAVISQGSNTVKLNIAAGSPVAGVIPSAIDTTNIAQSAVFSIIVGKGDPATFLKSTAAALAAGNIRVASAASGLVVAHSVGTHAIGIVASAAASVTSVTGALL